MTASGITDIVLDRSAGRCFVCDVFGRSIVVDDSAAVEGLEDEMDMLSSPSLGPSPSISPFSIFSCAFFSMLVSWSVPRSELGSASDSLGGDPVFSEQAIVARWKRYGKEEIKSLKIEIAINLRGHESRRYLFLMHHSLFRVQHQRRESS